MVEHAGPTYRWTRVRDGTSSPVAVLADGVTAYGMRADGARGIVRKSLWPKAPALRPTGIAGWAWAVDCELNTGFGVLPLVDGCAYVYGGTLAWLFAQADWRRGTHYATDVRSRCGVGH